MEAAAAETMQAIDAAAAAAEAMVALERHPDEPLIISDDDAPESIKELKSFQPAKGTLLGLMGLPAAGKSTLCEKLRDIKTHDIKIVQREWAILLRRDCARRLYPQWWSYMDI